VQHGTCLYSCPEGTVGADSAFAASIKAMTTRRCGAVRSSSRTTRFGLQRFSADAFPAATFCGSRSCGIVTVSLVIRGWLENLPTVTGLVIIVVIMVLTAWTRDREKTSWRIRNIAIWRDVRLLAHQEHRDLAGRDDSD